MVTVPEVKNRIHAFYVKEDAQRHAEQFRGKRIENPFGAAFVLPEAARLETLEIGAPDLPDSIPLRLAIFRPIFKENRLDVRLVPIEGEDRAQALVSKESVSGLICDLPAGLMLAKGGSVRIVKNVLRANPFRPFFALTAARGVRYEDFMNMKGPRQVAVPDGLSTQFYREYYLKGLGPKPGKFVLQRAKDTAHAWDLLNRGEVSAALLRTPYTDMASAGGMVFWPMTETSRG